VITDSAEDCNSGQFSNFGVVSEAFAAVPTVFPKHVWSKRDMQYNQYQLTGNCMTNGHTFEPLNIVFANRYFNMICNPAVPAAVFEPIIPVCVDLGNQTYTDDHCFGHGNWGWMDNIFQVCPLQYVEIANRAPEGYCALTDLDKENTTPLPYCPHLSAEIIESLAVPDPATGSDSAKRDSSGFDGFVYAIAALCFLYIVVESVRAVKLPPQATSISPVRVVVVRGAAEHTAPGRQAGYSSLTLSNVALHNEESPTTAPDEDGEGEMGVRELLAEAVVERGDAESGGIELAAVHDQTSANNAVDSPVPAAASPAGGPRRFDTWLALASAYLSAYFTYPIAAQSDRFEALGFARFLASVHIVLGHMYQASHLGSFHNFNKFGFTWVPWFFLLSGCILTHTEKRRRDRVQGKQREQHAAAVTSGAGELVAPAAVLSDNNGGTEEAVKTAEGSANTAAARVSTVAPPMGLVEYVLHRLRTLYPLYLVGIAAAIITVWATKGASQLPPPGDVLVYFLLLQGWVPSILEYGLVYLVQCWFLSCMLFYWVLFYKIYELLQGLSDRTVVAVAFTCSVVLPLVYQLATFTIAGWTDSHDYLSTDSGVDVAVVVLKFTPLAYLHIFVLGCCLPRVRAVALSLPGVESVLPWVALLSYTCLIIIYVTAGDEVPGYLLSFRLGLVSIVQCALLVGLCNSQDLLGRLFTHPFFQQFGLYSFAQYVFQFIVYAWFNYGAQQDMVDIRFFLLLFSTSVVVWTAVTPFNGDRMKSFVLACIPVLVAYLMLQPFLASYQQGGSDASFTAFPSWQTDRVLPVFVANDVFTLGRCSSSGY
jgi:peptidoglycan/LPS O-acetylase OafA/YrhL